MGKIGLALVSKRNHPKKYQLKGFFQKKQVNRNWFL